jgi:outer membrane protein TolC
MDCWIKSLSMGKKRPYMRRPDCLALLAALLLSGCATSALKLAPGRHDRAWHPMTDSGGAILAGEAPSPSEAASNDFVLPANHSLETLPAQPNNVDIRHEYDLAELIDIAQSNNPSTRVAWDQARNAALAAGIVQSSYLPYVSANIIGGYQTGHQVDSALGRSVGSAETASGSISAVSLRWLLFDFGERDALVDAARQGSVISNVAFTEAHQQVIYKVSLAFYAHAADKSRAESAVKALQNAKDVQQAADERYKHGVGTVVETAQAQQATAQAQLSLVQADGKAQDSYFALIAAMGISPLTKIKVATVADRKLSSAMADPIERTVAAALARRPDMLSAYAARQASLANIRAAEAEFMPKLFVSTTGAYSTGGLNVTSIPGIGSQDPTLNLSNHQWGATVLFGVTVPLFDGGVRSARLQQAQSNADRADATLAMVRNEATHQIVSASNAVKTGLAAYDAAHALASAAQTSFNAALAAYRNGVGSITAVTIAETQLLEARNAETDSYFNAMSAAATLALSVGTLGNAPGSRS